MLSYDNFSLTLSAESKGKEMRKKMQSLRFTSAMYVLAVLLSGLSACVWSPNPSVRTQALLQAEAWMWTAPDSALQLLQALPSAESFAEGEQAAYALLLSHARYRCSVMAASDSLIDIAVRYYDRQSDKNKQGKAWYLKGAIEEDRNELSQAALAYKKAESCIPDMTDLYTISHIYSSLGYINHRTRHYVPAKEYFQKAWRISQRSEDMDSQVSALINLLHLHRLLGETDSLDACADRLERLAPLATDTTMLATAYHNMAMHYQSRGDTARAAALLTSALQLTPHTPSSRTLVALFKLYMRAGRRQQADSMLLRIGTLTDFSVRASLYDALYKDHIAREEYREAVRYADLFRAVADSFYTDQHHKAVWEVQAQYDQMELLYQNTRLTNRWLFTLLLFIGTGLVVAYLWHWRQKQIQQNYCRWQAETNRLQTQLAEVTQHNAQVHQAQMAALQEQLTRKKNELAEATKKQNRMELLFGSNHQRLHQADIQSMQAAFQLIESRTCLWEQDRPRLLHWLNISKNGLIEKLQTAYPSMKDRQIDICCLAALGFSIDEIADILHIDPRSVERYMGQICQVVHLEQRGKKGFFHFINTLLVVHP